MYSNWRDKDLACTYILRCLRRRLGKIGIAVEYEANYPWVYLVAINNKRVKEQFMAEHGFTVIFMGTRLDLRAKLTDIKEIFKLIRKYRDGNS